MKIAVTYDSEEVFQHFGKTSFFKVYEIENNEIVKSEVKDTEGLGHHDLATLLQRWGVELLICGGIGGGAIQALNNANVKCLPGVKGNCDQAVQDYLNGKLDYDENARCDHHDHEHHCHH